MTVCYLDTSALVKLVREEEETVALRAWLAAVDGPWVSSALAAVELRRAVRRFPGAEVTAEAILDSVHQIALTRSIIDRAGLLEPATLRSLDAIHLATACEIGTDLGQVVAYDSRLIEAIELAGLPFEHPGRIV